MMNTITSQTEYVFTFRLMSSLLIASEETVIINVGGQDKSSVVHPLTGMPFIPASSIKGKLRYMGHLLGFDKEQLDKWFGSEAAKNGPTQVNVKSVSAVSMPDSMLKKPFFMKAEASINRQSGDANPRFFQAVKPGITFECKLLINEYEKTAKAEHIIERLIEPALMLLEDHFIGSGGSRGYGRIKICDKGTVGARHRFVKMGKSDDKKDENDDKSLKFHRVYMKTPYFSDNRISSVTLAGCFACAMKTMGYEDKDIETLLKGNDFRITSALPVIHLKDSKIHFFPRPHYYVEGIRNHDNRKKFLYDFDFVSETIFSEFRKKPDFLSTLCKNLKSWQYHIDNGLCMAQEEYNRVKGAQELYENKDLAYAYIDKEVQKLYENRDLTHVAIDNDTGMAEENKLFQTEDHFYAEDTFGFYFLVQHSWTEQELKSILQVIARMGIGKDKSTAKGYFSFTSELLENNLQPVSEGTGKFISFSLVHPSVDDRKKLQESASSYYRVITRKGKRENNSIAYQDNPRVEKNRLFFLQEGSVFDFSIQGNSPCCYPTKNENKVYDFGRPFLLKVNN